MSKKTIIKISAFILFFIMSYLILCYLPSMRIKLDAPPGEYLWESIKHNSVYKTLISAVIGGIAAYMSRRLIQDKK
jgi:hypothetical protein